MLSPFPIVVAVLCIATTACTTPEPAVPRTSEAAAAGILNDYCPIRGRTVDTRITTRYDGHTIGFCASQCVNVWNELPDKNKDGFVEEQPGS